VPTYPIDRPDPDLRIQGPEAAHVLPAHDRDEERKVTHLLAVVQSLHVGNRARQRTVATLGELDERGRAKARTLAEHLGVGAPEPGLFDPPGRRPEAVETPHREVRLERTRNFGGPWRGSEPWRLGLDELLRRLLPTRQEEVAWAAVAEILTVARLCEPSANCTSRRAGTVPMPSTISSACRQRRSTTTGCTGRSTSCFPTRRRSSATSRSGSTDSSRSPTTCRSTTWPRSTSKGGAREFGREVRPKLGPPRGLQAGLRGNGRDAGGDPFRLRGIPRQSDQRGHGDQDRHRAGGAVREVGADLGDGPGDGERGEPGMTQRRRVAYLVGARQSALKGLRLDVAGNRG